MEKKQNNIKADQNQRSAFSIGEGCGSLPPRLQKRHEFLKVSSTNKKFVTTGFILQCGARTELTQKLRFGYTASRRVGGAVERNRVKRKLREITRLVLAPKIAKKGDYVLVGRKATIARPFHLLVKDAEKILLKIKDN